MCSGFTSSLADEGSYNFRNVLLCEIFLALDPGDMKFPQWTSLAENSETYTLCAWLQRHSISELKEAVRELLQCITMGLSYKNVYYQ